MKADQQPEIIEGDVEARAVLKGTASGHEGIVITTLDGEKFRLQRIGGNPFSDEITESLAGHHVTLEGYRLEGVFRFTRICDEEKAEEREGPRSKAPRKKSSS